MMTIVLALAAGAEVPLDAVPIPNMAKVAIQSVRAAAKSKDYVTLKRWMVPEFTWSFGGDGDADQAIEAWRKDPAALRELYRVTGKLCTYRTSVNDIQCPPNAGYKYRAGFTRTDDGWRMSYFVAGD